MDFSFDSLAVSVSTDEPADLDWLRDFLGPSFRVRSPAEEAPTAGRTIHLRADAELHAALTVSLAGTRERATAFVMDDGTVELPVFRVGESRVAWDAAFASFYRMTSPYSVEVVDRPPAGTVHRSEPRRARGALMRVVREWVMNAVRSGGGVPLHASGIARSGGAVLFAGAKRAGKTTLTAACLMDRAPWGLLANDRIVLARDGDGWRCRGMASIVSVRPASLEIVPGLGERLRLAAGGGTFARLDEPAPPAKLVDGRLGLGPDRFATALGSKLVGEAALHAIAFPSIDPDVRGIECRPLAAAESAARLQAVRFAAATPRARSELFDDASAPPFPREEEIWATVADIASTTQCIDLRLGPDAYAPATIDGFLGSFGS